MNWSDHKDLAVGLRDQGLADCVAARFALRPGSIEILGNSTTLAHLVAAKSQQSVEKLTKGYLLWHSRSFDPTKGHTPFTKALELQEIQRVVFDAMCIKLNRLHRGVIAELKWLESLAPHAPDVSDHERGNLQPLTVLAENTEYPFWSAASEQLVTAACGLTMENHGVRAIKALRTFLDAMSRSDPPQFTKPIRQFLEDLPFST
ncbi:MAG TPA: hypothetical protein PK867_20495, partial [Pirellulales bacterium]|nr:hypothetical protein [Pirellulales bacterium]